MAQERQAQQPKAQDTQAGDARANRTANLLAAPSHMLTRGQRREQAAAQVVREPSPTLSAR